MARVSQARMLSLDSAMTASFEGSEIMKEQGGLEVNPTG